jgi:3D (Asp-Asp-Asp) domain-containing protein
VTTSVTKPIADGLKVVPSAAGFVRATAHEAIKMKKGIIPLIPSKFRRAEEGVTIPVSLTQYCVQGETRRGRQTRHGILAADPRIFPLARYVDVYLGTDYLGRYLVDDTGGNVLGATLDIWNPNCREARIFGRHWGSAVLIAREVEQIPIADTPTRWDGLAER